MFLMVVKFVYALIKKAENVFVVLYISKQSVINTQYTVYFKTKFHQYIYTIYLSPHPPHPPRNTFNPIFI